MVAAELVEHPPAAPHQSFEPVNHHGPTTAPQGLGQAVTQSANLLLKPHYVGSSFYHCVHDSRRLRPRSRARARMFILLDGPIIPIRSDYFLSEFVAQVRQCVLAAYSVCEKPLLLSVPSASGG